MKNYLKYLFRPFFHFIRSHFYAILYFYPAKKLKIIAITGTDGKTTTSCMIYHVLANSGKKVALATTVWMSLPSNLMYRNKSKMTTLPPQQMQKFMKNCLEEKVEILILECSSIALHQYRMAGMSPFVAAVTNFSQEELMYHRTIESYANAKQRILYKAKYIILPLELESWKKKGKSSSVIIYKVENIPPKTLRIVGDYNYLNASIALEVGSIFDISKKKIFKLLYSFAGVPGRLQKIKDLYNRNIYVDYAVTPAAFQAVYKSLKTKFPNKRLIHVFGATGGGRDKSKRPLLGEIASQFCDVIILTDEESYGEKICDILDQIEVGISSDFIGILLRIENREEALAKALSIAEVGDIILTTGMGGELSRNVQGITNIDSTTSRILGGGDIPWNEMQILEKLAIKIKPIINII